MFKKLFNKYLVRTKPSDLIAALRAIRAKEGEAEIFSILNKLTEEPVSYPSLLLNILLDESLARNILPIISQKMLRENMDTGLAAGVMLSRWDNSKISMIALPKRWRSFLEKQKIRLHWFSSIGFVCRVVNKYKEGLSTLLRLIKYKNHLIASEKNYIFFMGFPETSLEKSKHDDRLDNFLTYAQERFPDHQLVFLGENRKIDDKSVLNSFPFPVINGHQKIKFLNQSLWMLLKATVAGILGKWQLIYIYSDWLFYCYTSFVDPKKLPQKIIFSNSCYIYRPLWTIEAERLGVEVALMFYATNTYNLLLSKGDYGLVPGYSNMTWSNYYTFHKNHADFLKNNIRKTHKTHVEKEPIPLEDLDEPFILIPGFKVALFDVQPLRDAFMAKVGRPTPIYTYEISKRIFEDLLAWCESREIHLIVKRKREVGKRLCPKYTEMLKKLARHPLFKMIDARFSPSKICKNVDVIVCQSFTSAALFAKKFEKPVAYYDPTFLFVKKQPAAQGISVLQGQEELFDWLNQKSNYQ